MNTNGDCPEHCSQRLYFGANIVYVYEQEKKKGTSTGAEFPYGFSAKASSILQTRISKIMFVIIKTKAIFNRKVKIASYDIQTEKAKQTVLLIHSFSMNGLLAAIIHWCFTLFSSLADSSIKNSSDSGFAIDPRLTAFSSGNPNNSLRIGISIFFPLSVFGICLTW